MKFYLNYETLKDICISMAENMKQDNYDEVVAVVRGGMTPAQIIAKHLKLTVGVYVPRNNELLLTNKDAKKIVFIEDLVAEGRTYNKLKSFMANHIELRWSFAPIIVDDSFPYHFKNYGMKTKHWCVFPWEDMNKMKEGDRGFFRDGTDSYGC